MRPFLVVDCNVDGRDWLGPYRDNLPALEVATATEAAPSDPTPYAGVVLTGSAASAVDAPPWLAAVEALAGRALAEEVPVLGICFGHQVLGRVAGGPGAVVHRARAEVGWLPVRVLEPDPIFEGFESRFVSFVSHGDEVRPAPGFRVLARSEACSVQALRVPGRPAWGVQFHLEMTREEEDRTLAKRLRLDTTLDGDALRAARVDCTPRMRRLFANFVRLAGAA